MTTSLKGDLLYSATRDGFTSLAFHYKFDGKDNTITITKINLIYVFRGLHPLLGKFLVII